MAATHVSPPGSDYGPCPEPCSHIDCAASRDTAASICRFCTHPIGYGRRYYHDPDEIRGCGRPPRWVHATCLYKALGEMGHR